MPDESIDLIVVQMIMTMIAMIVVMVVLMTMKTMKMMMMRSMIMMGDDHGDDGLEAWKVMFFKENVSL